MKAFWKEYTITLPSKKKFVFDIQNRKTNCIFIQNYNISNVFAGLKPHAYEVEIPPNRTSIINRPFPLEYVYFYTEKQTPITIVETVTQNPIASFIRQEVTKNTSLDTVNTIIQNTPLKICQLDAFRPNVIGWLVQPCYISRCEFIYNLGNFSAPVVGIILRSARGSTCGGWRRQHWNKLTTYSIYVFNKNTGYIKLARITFPITLRRPLRYYPPEIILYTDNIKLHSISEFKAHLSISNNTFRFISLIDCHAAPVLPDRVVIAIR